MSRSITVVNGDSAVLIATHMDGNCRVIPLLADRVIQPGTSSRYLSM